MQWNEDLLENLTVKIGSGATPRGGENAYKTSGISLIRSQNVYDFKFEPAGLAFINEEQADALANVEIQPNDILLNITGDSVGRCCIVAESVLPARVNQHVAIIRPNERLNSKFLLYYINEPRNKAALLQVVHGATRRALTKGIIQNYKVSFPPLPIQRHIVDILGALDDKIECNRRINQTLEQMAQALYKHWFVDFGPFRGSGPTLSVVEGFVDSELGRIPKGWKVVSLGELVSINPKAVNPQDYPDEEFLHFSIPAFDKGCTPTVERGEQILSGKTLVDSDRVLVSKLNPRIYRVWTVFAPNGQRALSSTEFINYIPKRSEAWAFVNRYVRHERFINEFRSHATGTTGSRQRVPPQRTLAFRLVLPPFGILSEFERVCGSYFKQADANLSENQTLAHTRGYLLPKLLSGEIEVKAAEELVEGKS